MDVTGIIKWIGLFFARRCLGVRWVICEASGPHMVCRWHALMMDKSIAQLRFFAEESADNVRATVKGD